FFFFFFFFFFFVHCYCYCYCYCCWHFELNRRENIETVKKKVEPFEKKMQRRQQSNLKTSNGSETPTQEQSTTGGETKKPSLLKQAKVRKIKRSDQMLRVNKKIYGNGRYLVQRKPDFVRAHRIGRPLRTLPNSKATNILSHLFFEMRAQNKVPGYKLPDKKRRVHSFGPKYMLQTRIGNVHHANIHDEIFESLQHDYTE
ncbi:hypothetical protein RFI_07309, partial [Reticulomyxa filosa]